MTLRFEALIAQHHDEIYHYIWRLLGAGGGDAAVEAQDITQEVFIRAYQAYGRLRAGSNHRAWLYKIATNTTYSALKQRRRDRHALPLGEEDHAQPADPAPGPADRLALAETLESVRDAIEALPKKQRAALVMRHLQGLAYAEIAGALECSEDSARANVYQALRRLRRALAAEG